jgi:hypothetical protein
MDLMLNSKSEVVSARMVEFFASNGKVSPVSINIDARQTRGYEYAISDQQKVEIRPNTKEAEPIANREAEAGLE